MSEPVTPEAEEEGANSRADLLAGLFFTALGVLVFYLAWTMPRLAERRIHPSTIPGLVPIFLGAALILCGGLLAWKAWRTPTAHGWRELGNIFVSQAALRVAAAIGLGLIFSLGLVGTMPFWAASAVFIFAFILVFEVYFGDRQLMQSLPWAAAVAIGASAAIFYVFGTIFLVRLP